MTDAKDNLPFLVLHNYHLSAEKGRQAVVGLFKRLDQKEPKEGWEKATLTLANEKKTIFQMSFVDMLNEARRKGIVTDLQRILDKRDGVFGGTLCDDLCTSNYEMTLATEFGEFKATVKGPCRTGLVEADLTDDILYYRAMACKHSNEHDFRLTARYFRNYLSACTSIVDAFVNRHIFMAKASNFTSPAFEDLLKSKKVEGRMELWWKTCCDDDPSPLFNSAHWCRFQEIRTKRNALLHAVDPIGTYYLPEIQQYLNKVRSGVGELLLLLRAAHKKPTLGFIERLRTAPKVAYQKIHKHKYGDRVIHVDQG